MTKPARRACYLLPAAALLAVIAAPCAAFASLAVPYLNWSAKAQPVTETPPQTEQVQTGAGAYPVPPSPYGQVGDPYARSLRWPAKQAPATLSLLPLAVCTALPKMAPAPKFPL